MDTELMNEIKTRYEEEFMKTEQGQKHAKVAKDIQEQATAEQMAFKLDPSSGQTTTTKGLRREYLPDVLHKAQVVKIVPIGLNNCCFQNATWLEEAFGFKKIYGFNIVGCECGGRMCFEIHALNRISSGELIDITRDYCGETEKWFVPFENEDYNQETNKALFGKLVPCFQPKCRCVGRRQKWDNTEFAWTDMETKFEEMWNKINNIGRIYWTQKIVD